MAEGFGAFGPYPHGRRWRVKLRARDGEVRNCSFATSAAAQEFKDAADAEIKAEARTARTIASAIEKYEEHLTAKGNRASSIAETPRRLRWFFAEDLEDEVGDLHPPRARDLYQRITTATYQCSKGGEPQHYSVDTCRNTLAEARTFLAWCVAQRWLKANPLDGVKGIGKRTHGKQQLTIDEARAWSKVALERARKGDAGAIAALLTVVLGMRASEIIERQVREVDDDGRLLRISKAKTKKGVRALEVPDVLRPMLKRLTRLKKPEDLLFGEHWRDWPRHQVHAICDAAKVPRVTAHGMRGLHSSLAREAGATGHLVASALGHESEQMAQTAYTSPAAEARAKQRAAMKVLEGGKKRRP